METTIKIDVENDVIDKLTTNEKINIIRYMKENERISDFIYDEYIGPAVREYKDEIEEMFKIFVETKLDIVFKKK